MLETERIIEDLRRQLVEKERVIGLMQRSLSWKIGRLLTAPLRKLKNSYCQVAPSWNTVRGILERARPRRPAETSVQALYENLTDQQKAAICFDWDYQHPVLGQLRTFVSRHWQVTRPVVRSDFFTRRQQGLIHDIFRSLLAPEWYPRFLQQTHDDCLGHPWGTNQSIAIFGTPGQGPSQFVITGRHLTLRADANAEGKAAFGGPIFYGHAASGYYEPAHHPGNVFWPQAQQASQLFRMLDGRQRRLAVVDRRPIEPGIEFALGMPQAGISISELTADQEAELGRVLRVLIEPFRPQDQQRVWKCLQQLGGLRHCTLAYYREGNLGGEEEWDNWRLTGPAFAWYFRGTPHVHAWVHVANDPSAPLNASNDVILDPIHDPLH